ncbi:MAG: stage II sporulation protein M [Candidatus Aenigmatarchaeota archaeon]
MVLESLFPEKKIKSKPVDILVLAFLVALVAIFASYFVFPKYAGIVAPLITALGMAPLIFRLFEEEEDEIDEVAEKRLIAGFFARHKSIISLFTLFFIGNFLAVFFIAVLLPDVVLQSIFEPQLADINAVQSIGSATGSAVRPGLAETIVFNNLKVMAFAFLLSFLFGTGATFILSWNASILGIFLANYAREGLYHTLLLTTTGMFPHATVELVAYFLAGIGGGILSVGMVREKFMSAEFRLMLKDSLLLLVLSVAFVLVGAWIEAGL